MPDGDYLMLMWVGGGFIILALIAIFWGKHEEKSYFNQISTRSQDLREFMEHWPSRPQPGALKIGGWITLAIGVVMLLAGFVLWFFAGTPA